jgi:transposase InsO family protein
MLPRKGGPDQRWAAFLRNHADGIAAIDMLCVPTFGFRRLYALVVLSHRRREILHIAVTDHPTAPWLAWQAQQAFVKARPRFVVRENDGAYGHTFRMNPATMGIRDAPTRPHSPWQNGHVERLIGSIRRECLDHIVIFNARHLYRVLSAYVEYYNRDRTHLSLGKDSPLGRTVEKNGKIRSCKILGGLHQRYYREPD